MAQPSAPIEITVEFEGKLFHGWYTLGSGLVTVRTNKDSQCTQLGGMDAEALAKILLLELVRKGKA